MNAIAIRAEGLTKQYQVGARRQPAQRLSDLFSRGRGHGAGEAFRALDDVSFEIAHGEIVGIVGGNGAGKSTLLKILSRVVRPSAGSAELHGRLASLLEVGTGFHPELTGRENIYMSGIILGMTRTEIARRFDEIVAFAGVDRFLDTPIKWYSSGMQTRLGFAVAAHLEAEILLIDEVLAVGDAEFQKKCLGKMKEVAIGGRTVLFISHSMDSVQKLCGRAIWLDKGRVRADSADVRQVTLEYLSGGKCVDPVEAPSQPRAEWLSPRKANKDAPVFLRAMRLLNAEGDAVTAPAPHDVSLKLQLELEIRRLDPALMLGYALYTEEGDLLWWSYHTDATSDEWPKLQIGNNYLSSRLPAGLLNEGRYRLEFVCCISRTAWLYEPGSSGPVVDFEVQGISKSPFWSIKRQSKLAPVLTWENTKCRDGALV
jgi:lipopolysaccharide transport system ATP-binding protein